MRSFHYRQRTQCGAGSCGGWGLVLDIAAIFAAMDMSNMRAYIIIVAMGLQWKKS